jgi:WD40 repeat protein
LINVVQWNPQLSSYIAGGVGENLHIWDINQDPNNSVVATFKSHSRTINDLMWSPIDPTIIATCSADTFIYLWDFR